MDRRNTVDSASLGRLHRSNSSGAGNRRSGILYGSPKRILHSTGVLHASGHSDSAQRNHFHPDWTLDEVHYASFHCYRPLRSHCGVPVRSLR